MTVAVVPEPKRREPPSLELASYGDLLFRGLLTLAAVAIPVVLGFLVYELWVGSRLAIEKFGLDFVTTSTWDPVAEEFGENAPDDGALVSDCTETVLAGAEPGNVSKSPVVRARCERSERCDKLPMKNCLATFSQLDGMQRAVFTSLYNLRAQNEIAGCLSDSDCGPEPEDACLKKWYDQRVWLPLSLARLR